MGFLSDRLLLVLEGDPLLKRALDFVTWNSVNQHYGLPPFRAMLYVSIVPVQLLQPILDLS